MTQPAPCADIRTANLPLPAVKLAQRMAQLVNGREPVVQVSVLVADGVWYILVNGKYERLGVEERT